MMLRASYKTIRPTNILSNKKVYEIIEIHPKLKTCDDYKYFGVLKKEHHYINNLSELFIKDDKYQNEYKYVLQWSKNKKMPYSTCGPQQYKSLSLNNKEYFYDYKHLDTYKYDEQNKKIKYVGKYNKKYNMIRVC